MIVDSGATISIGDPSLFLKGSLKPCNTAVICANGDRMICTQRGTMLVTYNGQKLEIVDALCISNVANLLSVDQLVKMGFIVVFENLAVSLFTSKANVILSKPLFELKRKIGQKLWVIDQPLLPYVKEQNYSKIYGNRKQKNLAMSLVTKSLSSLDLMVLHLRFAHSTLPRLKLIFPEYKSLQEVEKLPLCDACLSMGYKTRYKKISDYSKEWNGEGVAFVQDSALGVFESNNNFLDVENLLNFRENSYTAVQDEFHANIVDQEPSSSKYATEEVYNFSHDDTPKGYGRMFMTDTKSTSKVSVRGYLYLYLILDRDTRLCEAFLGRDKNDLELHLKNFLRRFYNRHKRFPAFWKFDQGGENYSHSIINFLKSCGTQALFTTTNAHNQNSHIERKIGVVWDSMLKTMAYTHVPFVYWCYCVVYICFVWNHIPHRALGGKIPVAMAKMKSYTEEIRVWGCGVWYSLPKNSEHETRKRFGMNLGWSTLKLGWVILDIEKRDIVDSRDVIWIETYLPFKQLNSVSKIVLNCDNWPVSRPEEKISMKLENMLIKSSNIIDDGAQSGGDHVNDIVNIPVTNNNSAAAPEIPVTLPTNSATQQIPVTDPISIPMMDKTIMNDSVLSPIPQEDSFQDVSSRMFFPDDHKHDTPPPKFSITPSKDFTSPKSKSLRVNSPTFIHDDDGQSPTFVLPQNKFLYKKNGVEEKNKENDNIFQDTLPLLGDTIPTDSMFNDESFGKSFENLKSDRPAGNFNENDPLSISNSPSKEKAISQRRNENFKVNGRKAEGLSPIISGSRKRRYLNLNEKIPVVKDLIHQPTAEKPIYYEVQEILDIQDTKLSSDKGYDLKIKWKLSPGDSVNQESWEPAENVMSKKLMNDFKKSKIFIDYLASKKLSKLVPKVSKKTNSFKGIRMTRARNYKSHLEAQRWKDYNAGNLEKSFTEEFTPPEDSNLRRSARVKKNQERIFSASDFDSIYFGSVPPYVSLEEKERIDKLFLAVKDSSDSEDIFENEDFTEEPSVEKCLHQAFVSMENAKEIPKPPDYSEHPKRTLGNKELNQVIQRSIDKVMEQIGIEVEAPKTRSSMLKGNYEKEFKDAELSELESIRKHGTFEEVDRPRGATPITCRWVYDYKRNKEGKVTRFKARLVVQGYKQQEGIDFDKTFSSTAQIRSFRIMVSLSVIFDLPIHQYDVSNAFLNSKMDREVFMEWPPGYEESLPKRKGTVIKLLKALYGLHQASRLWQQTLYKVLAGIGFDPCKTESGVLHRTIDGKFDAMITIWVDDLALMCKEDKIRVQVEKTLKDHFSISSEGLLSLYVGIVVEKDSKGKWIKLHQGPYHEKSVKKFLPDDATVSNVPANPAKRLSKLDSPTTDGERVKVIYPYMNATGTQLYSAICTRPDIFYQTINLAKFNNNPGKEHVKASEDLFRYIKGTQDLGVKYTKPKNFDGKIEIRAFVDSDWAGCVDTRRSTIGYIIQIAGGPVSWKSKTIKTIAQSSCEAEFMGLTEVCRELMWLCNFLEELGIAFHAPKIYCDSQSAIYWASDPIEHARNKHMEVKYYYVRDCVSQDKVRLFKILTTYQCADMMTKPLGKQILDRLVPSAMGYMDPILIENKPKE